MTADDGGEGHGIEGADAKKQVLHQMHESGRAGHAEGDRLLKTASAAWSDANAATTSAGN